MKILIGRVLCVVACSLLSFVGYSQSFSSYYYDYKLLNPAFVGMKDKHIVTLMYSGRSHGDLQFMYGAYETSIPSIQAGIGRMVSYRDYGPVNKVNWSDFFSKKLKFGERTGMRFGVRPHYERARIYYSRYQELLNPGDPALIPAKGYEEETRFNLDAGLLFCTRWLNVGFAVNNFLKKDPAFGLNTGTDTDEYAFNVILTKDLKISENFTFTPSMLYLKDREDSRVDINSTFEIRRWLLLGAGYSMAKKDDFSFNAGFKVRDFLQVIAHCYSSRNSPYRDYFGPTTEVMVRGLIPQKRKRST